MIEQLTPEQEALLPVYAERWIKIGLDTTTNKQAAEEAVALAYQKVGLQPPKKYIWFDSPLGQALGYHIFTKVLNNQKNMASVGASVWDSVGASVGASVWDSVGDSVWASVRASVWDSVGASVWVSVWDSVWASVWDSVRASVWDSVGDSVGDWYYKVWEGSHVSHIPAFYSYFGEQLGIDTSLMDGLNAISRTCGWVYFGKEVALLSPKPSILKTTVNARGRHVLHCEDGPAIRYNDGFEIWAYNGVRLNKSIYQVPVREWRPEWILEESNADVRAALLQAIGYERFLEHANAKVIDTWKLHNLPYELLEWHDDAIGRMVFLKMKNPSVPGVYHVEPVAPHDWIQTCEDAMRWRQIGDAAKDKTVTVDYSFIH